VIRVLHRGVAASADELKYYVLVVTAMHYHHQALPKSVESLVNPVAESSYPVVPEDNCRPMGDELTVETADRRIHSSERRDRELEDGTKGREAGSGGGIHPNSSSEDIVLTSVAAVDLCRHDFRTGLCCIDLAGGHSSWGGHSLRIPLARVGPGHRTIEWVAHLGKFRPGAGRRAQMLVSVQAGTILE
jgi:hypothetical protein